jgi:uncharacterized BrkB/YihY/UPF0761 family membrane protein
MQTNTAEIVKNIGRGKNTPLPSNRLICTIFIQGGKMRFSISTIIGIILGVSTFMFFVSNVRPVGWFDSLVGMILGVVVFIVVKNFKGFK